ncbi:putative acetyltransferase [Sphingorhabdus rigui]|uniref:Putative acetyltransferase n=1 Tax=Sphingorhabdus rigui TaxID=1282858 RepID=A0A840AUE3_9SPHN|nr:GNAT family N-acetyltransferase [Sphingorhabdus rigui]MBB3941929.1 putative acetyltransferase [Sphingorhabdus rigui]
MNTMPHPLTWATPTDTAELADVMFDAVRNGPSKYTDAQRAAWVPERRRGVEWEARLAAKDIAIGRDGDRIIGFMSIEGGGYIDFAFIRPEAQGSGLFRRLFELVEARARAANEARLWVHASLMAQPAFAAVGFSVVEHQIVQIGDQQFQRAMMEKPLVTAV